MTLRVAVAGATGSLGREVVRLAKFQGLRVTAVGRDEERLSRLGADGILVVPDFSRAEEARELLKTGLKDHDCVFSCLGASVLPDPSAGRKTYSKIDLPYNRLLIEAAKEAGVPRFVYVSLTTSDSLKKLDYVAAHEEVVGALASSGLEYAVVRPTGFFSAFAAVLEMAKKGSVPLMGVPDCKTNPIDDAELAEVCVDAIKTRDFGEREVGGPEVLTRKELVEAAFAALEKPAQTRRVPTPIVKVMTTLIKPFNPRMANIAQFFLTVSSQDCVAPPYGKRKIGDFFRDELAKAPKAS